ncbi:MAG: hypothetical protein IPO47_07945 [Bacteroidetes bacterium]|nr:hypothetical protein [Bacteroidota bacterium]
MHKLYIMSIAVLVACNAFSQSHSNNWVFGDSTGLNFSTPIPTFLKHQYYLMKPARLFLIQLVFYYFIQTDKKYGTGIMK